MTSIIFNTLCIGISVFIAYCIGLYMGHTRQPKINTSHAGNIIINTKDPIKDTIRIELDIPITEMMQKDILSFKVLNEELT